ncbi:hypothetical protein [Undibacterium griseum]|uniref:Uncharacterized protein n=1 Tax=Undibacterium griseum TaxID=2762295 RepID=A0ABR6YRE0_9BURK|nr:hypothetical protein [Undibacterium griseum]MBC3886359.1 hypothetical protein [Undibacterium griseum]
MDIFKTKYLVKLDESETCGKTPLFAPDSLLQQAAMRFASQAAGTGSTLKQKYTPPSILKQPLDILMSGYF